MKKAELRMIKRLEELQQIANEELENNEYGFFAEEVIGFTAELLAILRKEYNTFDQF